MRKAVFSSFLLLSILTAAPAAAQVERASLGLNGANVHHLEVSDDGSLVIASCQGPYGIFYSTDFGDTWTDARDDAYEGGEGKSSVIFDDDNILYALAGTTIYSSSTTTPLEWSEESFSVDDESLDNAVIASGGDDFLLVGTRDGMVVSIAISDESVTDNETTPEENQITSISVDTTNNLIFVVAGNHTEQAAEIYRTTYDETTGAIGSTWVQKEPADPTGYFTHVAVAPNGNVYTGTQNAETGNGIYVSTDNGDTWALIQEDAEDVTDNATFSYFAGTVYLVGSHVSTDSGTTWDSLPRTEDDSNLNPNAGIINPADTDNAIMSSDVGAAKTENLSNGDTSTWSESNEGLEGLVVNGLGQVDGNKERVMFATKSGLAFSNDFLSGPTWTYPIFPLSNGAPARDAAFDPNDEDRVFAGYSQIYEGTIDTSATPPVSRTEVAAADETFTFMNVTEMTTYDDTLVVAFLSRESDLHGRLRFYDISSGGFTLDSTVLEGKPVNSFARTSATVMYAAVGTTTNISGSTDSDNLGVWKSTDGGSTWNKETDATVTELEDSVVVKLAYDETNDILYAAAADIDSGEMVAGSVFVLEDASTGSGTWSIPASDDLNRDQQFSGVTVDPGTGVVYASAGNLIFVSTDLGQTWGTYYTGLENESTSVLYFDDLVQCSTTGCFMFEGENLTLSNVLSSPTYVTWNGYHGLTNIAELGNRDNEDLEVTITLYDVSGSQQGETTVTIPGADQLDVSLNAITGFTVNSYGLARFEWSGDSNLGGRMFYYKPSSVAGEFDYAYGQPFSNALNGDSYTKFNSIHPSTNPAETGIVEQWLSVLNLDTTNARSFEIIRYDLTGTQAGSQNITVPPLGRIDVEAGHVNPGVGNAGSHRIVPANSSADYKAELIRYGQTDTGTEEIATTGSDYTFALPFAARQGVGTEQWAVISEGANGDCWVEVINASSETAEFTLSFFDSNGLLEGTIDDSLSANEIRHYSTASYLNTNETGSVRIVPDDSSSDLFLEALTYYRDSSGNIQSASVSASVAARTGKLWNTWNRFLGMYNWLRIVNTSENTASVTVTVYSASESEFTEDTVSIDPMATSIVNINDVAWDTTANGYGVFAVEPTTAGLVAELLRLKPVTSDITLIDFGAVTPQN